MVSKLGDNYKKSGGIQWDFSIHPKKKTSQPRETRHYLSEVILYKLG
jgi:hypothetical protein